MISMHKLCHGSGIFIPLKFYLDGASSQSIWNPLKLQTFSPTHLILELFCTLRKINLHFLKLFVIIFLIHFWTDFWISFLRMNSEHTGLFKKWKCQFTFFNMKFSNISKVNLFILVYVLYKFSQRFSFNHIQFLIPFFLDLFTSTPPICRFLIVAFTLLNYFSSTGLIQF